MRIQYHPHFYLAFLTGALLCTTILSGQAVLVQTDSSEYAIGAPVRIRIEVAGNLPAGVDLSAWEAIVPKENWVKTSDFVQNEAGKWVQERVVVVFDTGSYVLPAIPLTLGDNKIVETQPVRFRVKPFPVNSTELAAMADIKDIQPEAKIWTDYLWVGWIIGGLLVMALLMYWLSRRKKDPVIYGATPPIPPRNLAIQKLDHLERAQLWQQGRVKEYYTGISWILREFLENEAGLRTLPTGAQDALAIIREKRPESKPLWPELERALSQADVVKYAKGAADEHLHVQVLADAQKIVTEWS